MMLSPHFSLEEMTATRRKLPNEPHAGRICMLRLLAVSALEPLRVRTGPLRVSSGYRSAEVNAAVGGHPESAHLDGRAADVVPMTTTRELAWGHLLELIHLGLLLDQVIVYEATNHLHITIARTGAVPRGQKLVRLAAPHEGRIYMDWNRYRELNRTLPTL